jgi:uncharacterized phage protein (TIGR01671 family)
MFVDDAGKPWCSAGELDTTDANSIFEQRIRRLGILPVMQFTGLVDKNGKEIYEGDVLRFDNYMHQGKVVFDFGQFFVQIDGRFYCSIAALAHPKDGYGCEIIGNIYENPELLINGTTTQEPST